MSIILKTDNLCKKYGQQIALDNVSMTINKGEIYGFVGRNGAGKTTLIRLITKLINATSGSFTLDVDKSLGKIGAIIEGPAIYANLSAMQNLKAQGMLVGVNDEAKFKDVLKTVGLNPDDKKAKDYSLGMKQRLGIAMALLSDPEFLILDEPANGLDPKGMVEIRELIIKINKEKGVTVLISSHILSELDKMATTYGFIEKGKLICEKSAEEVHSMASKTYTYYVTDTSEVRQALYNKYGIEDTKIIDGKSFEIKQKIELTNMVETLSSINVSVDSIHENTTDLEKFFIDLIGGASR